MSKNLLSDTKIRHLRPGSKDQWLCDGRGLYLRVRTSGTKTWILRRKRHGKTQITTLGHYPALSLAKARLLAAQLNLEPGYSSMTINELADRYLDNVVYPTHRRPELVEGYLDRAVLPAFGNQRVREVSRADCVELIERYARQQGRNGRPAARSADQLRSVMKSLFGYAVELGIRETNPLTGVTRRVSGYRPIPRNRVLRDDEIRLLWKEQHPNARLLRFLLLTGLRIGEAQRGQWARNKKRWIVPAEISKNKREHWVHLTDLAEEQLPLPDRTATGVQAWTRRFCSKHNINPRFTPHDLRRTFITRANELGIAPHVIERCVNHKLDGLLAVYNHAEYEKERIETAIIITEHIRSVIN